MTGEIVWQAPEFEYREKTVSWFWVSIFFGVAFLGIAVWQRNFLFAVFVVVAELLILVWGARKPNMIDFRLTGRMLHVGPHTQYSLGDLASWSIDAEEPIVWPTVALHFHARLQPLVHVRVPKERLAEIEGVLGEFANKAPWEENFIDTLEKFFRF